MDTTSGALTRLVVRRCHQTSYEIGVSIANSPGAIDYGHFGAMEASALWLRWRPGIFGRLGLKRGLRLIRHLDGLK